jgi:hypothetical protein
VDSEDSAGSDFGSEGEEEDAFGALSNFGSDDATTLPAAGLAFESEGGDALAVVDVVSDALGWSADDLEGLSALAVVVDSVALGDSEALGCSMGDLEGLFSLAAVAVASEAFGLSEACSDDGLEGLSALAVAVVSVVFGFSEGFGCSADDFEVSAAFGFSGAFCWSADGPGGLAFLAVSAVDSDDFC